MSMVIDPEERGSAWRDDGGYMLHVSRTEYQMLLHLRMLGSGVHAVRVRKEGKGMRGLREFRVTEVVIPRASELKDSPQS